MATNPSIAENAHVPSKQFTLRQAAVWTAWISIVLALGSQIGTVWGPVLWLVAGATVLGYAAYRGWIGWIGMALFGAGFVLYWLVPLISEPRY